MTDGSSTDRALDDPRGFLLRHAPWLFDPGLDTCIVGTVALAEALHRRGAESPDGERAVRPAPADLDLAWRLGVDDGAALLQRHGVQLPTTANSRARGTLAVVLAGERIEITTFKGGGAPDSAPLADVLAADTAHRDMTVGAVVWHLASDALHDPTGGIDDWEEGVVRAVGDPAERIAEHPVRWLRYYRKAHTWGFALDGAIRRLPPPAPAWADALPAEVVAAEFRAALLDLGSPGRWFLELHEAGVLQAVAPELAPQFDGRPAGPVRHHPEVSQALHLILVLEWAARNTHDLDERDRLAVLVACLTHDLGKNDTPPREWPSHRGHENAGRAVVRAFLARLPGLADAAARRLADTVCALHLLVHRLRDHRSGTLARIYDEHLRGDAVRPDLIARVAAADRAGRLGADAELALDDARRIERDLDAVRDACSGVDAAQLKARAGDDLDAFRRALHEERARAIRRALRAPPPS